MDLIWLRVAAALYILAAISAMPAVLYGLRRWRRVCLPAATAAFFFHFVSVVEMLGSAHHWLPVSPREVESLLGLVIVAIFLVLWRVYRTDSLGIFALPAACFLVLAPAIGTDPYVFPSQGVRTGWLVVHIAALLVAYAALGFSMVASFLYLVQERRLKQSHHLRLAAQQGNMDWLPPLDTLERMAHSTLLMGFHAMTLGLLVGSLLAQASVGPAYFMDPKVVFSFGMWALYVVLLFIRRSAGLRGRKAAYLSSGVFVVMLAVWAVNQFSQVHRFLRP